MIVISVFGKLLLKSNNIALLITSNIFILTTFELPKKMFITYKICIANSPSTTGTGIKRLFSEPSI